MRASILLSLLPFTAATIVYPSDTTNCGNNLGTFSSCGCTGLRNFVVRSARVNFERATVRFHAEAGCVGARISVAR